MIEVLYKDYDPNTCKPILTHEYYGSWNEDGNYTVFYSGISLDSAVMVIPTTNVCWIKLNKTNEGNTP